MRLISPASRQSRLISADGKQGQRRKGRLCPGQFPPDSSAGGFPKHGCDQISQQLREKVKVKDIAARQRWPCQQERLHAQPHKDSEPWEKPGEKAPTAAL